MKILRIYIVLEIHLGASVNVMPKSMFEHLKLANLKETGMLVEMADMTRKAPLGIVENILAIFSNIHAQIDVFNREISLGIGEDRVLFDMDGGVYHSKIHVEKVYMANSIQEEESFNPLEIEDDVFSYESPACLLFEQCTRSCDNESIDTLDSVDNMQELEVKHEDMVQSLNLERIISRWHVCKLVRVFYDNECGKDCGMEHGMLEQWTCFRDHERQGVDGNRMIFTDFLKVRYGNKTIDDITRERRYYEWVTQNSEFNDNGISHEATIYENPCKYHHEYPRLYFP
ncbi:hypothetical protein Tco_0721271 [Tanacetum coccineum]